MSSYFLTCYIKRIWRQIDLNIVTSSQVFISATIFFMSPVEHVFILFSFGMSWNVRWQFYVIFYTSQLIKIICWPWRYMTSNIVKRTKSLNPSDAWICLAMNIHSFHCKLDKMLSSCMCTCTIACKILAEYSA